MESNKNISEFINKTEIRLTDIKKKNLWSPKGRGGWWKDKLGIRHWQIKTTIYKIYKQQGGKTKWLGKNDESVKKIGSS